jgi:hypothetical protein
LNTRSITNSASRLCARHRRHGSDASSVPGVPFVHWPLPMSPFPSGNGPSNPPIEVHWSQLPLARNVRAFVSTKTEQAGELPISYDRFASLDPLPSSICEVPLNSRLGPPFKPRRRRLPEKLDRTDRAARSFPGAPEHEAGNARAAIGGRNTCA